MRADPNLYANINTAIQQSESSLQTAMNQLSSGKRVALPSDDPLAFAQSLQVLASSANVDRYTTSADAVLSQAQMADSALSSVTTSLTQALSLGTEGGNSSLTSSQRGALAQQLQGLLATVVAQANTTVNGVALFAGTANTTTPFVPDPTTPNGYTYAGNSNTNQVQVGDNLQVTAGLPGNSVFLSPSGNVLGSLQQMITALQSGSATNIASADASITAAIAQVGQSRAAFGGTVNQLNQQTSFLSQEKVTLSSQETNLVDVDTATAATNLVQAQTQNSAVLAAAAKVLPQSLLTFLH